MANDKNEIKVLVVDDSAFMRKIIQDILSSDNEIKVISTARNGKEALEKVKSLKPDVITLDVEMPEVDGLSCLKEINKITDIPVIMLSGLTREGADLTIRALESGAIDFITKPVNLFSLAGEEKKKEEERYRDLLLYSLLLERLSSYKYAELILKKMDRKRLILTPEGEILGAEEEIERVRTAWKELF